MSRDVLFDEALDAAARAVEGAGIDLSGCIATLLRDLRGKLRLHIQWPEDRSIPEDAKNQLKKRLASIGPYATNVVYLETEAKKGRDFPLIESLERERLSFKPDLGGIEPVATWYRFERRFSKDAWLPGNETGFHQQPWPYVPGRSPLVISFYGFKGGVGRTTALAAFALYAAEQLAKNVAVVDLDLEAPGIGSLLLGEEDISEEDPAYTDNQREITLDLGVVDFLLEQRIGRTPSLPLSRFYVGSPHVTGTGSIRVVPAGRLDHRYLEKLGRVDVHGLVEPGQPVREPLLELLKRLRDELTPDVILLDVRAGLHDLGGVSLSGLSHLELIFAVHSPQTWAGLPMVLEHLGRLRADWIKMVHAMVPPESRGGKELHEQFVTKAYNVLSRHYYKVGEIPGPTDEAAAHWAYRLPFREALMAISSLSSSRSSLLADEHRVLCEQLAKDSGLGAT
ncbi:hypothetical protein WME91_24205 [Sorangium sp. So ce269]